MTFVTTLASSWYAVAPSSDATGATDSANIASALAGFPRRRVTLLPGTFYVSAPIAPQNETVIEGVGRNLTSVLPGSSFSGSCLYQANLGSTLRDVNLNGSSNAADGVSVTQISGAYISGVILKDVSFQNIGGKAVSFIDTGSAGAPTGCVFDGIYDLGGNHAGIIVVGHSRTIGVQMSNINMNPSGGGDALSFTDVFDIEVSRYFLGAAGSGSALHLIGHCANGRFDHSETGGGYRNILIEDNANGHSSNLTFLASTFQTSPVIADVGGSCYDILFDSCRFLAAQGNGVNVSTSGSGIKFHGCEWGTSAGQGNGQGKAGGNYDLCWSGTGLGEVTASEFGSPIEPPGSVGVSYSVSIAAGQHVPFNDVKFTGANASSSNWFTNLPAMVLETGSGRFNFAAGL